MADMHATACTELLFMPSRTRTTAKRCHSSGTPLRLATRSRANSCSAASPAIRQLLKLYQGHPRSKAERLVLTERLVEAGLTLIREAEMLGKTALARAVGVRNGLLIALLALHPIRIKNFAALTIADTFINIDGRWWLHIPSDDTKVFRVDQRQVPEFITDVVDSYINTHRPVLCRGDVEQLALWVSSTTGRQLTTKNLGTLISKITRETVGVDVSPHLFRTAGASTAAVYGGKHSHLASALLAHRDPRVTEEHYNRAMGLSAGEEYASITQLYRQRRPAN
jgi:integrase